MLHTRIFSISFVFFSLNIFGQSINIDYDRTQQLFIGDPFEIDINIQLDSVENNWVFSGDFKSEMEFQCLKQVVCFKSGKNKIGPFNIAGIQSNQLEVFIHKKELSDSLVVEVLNSSDSILTIKMFSLKLKHSPSIKDFDLIPSKSYEILSKSYRNQMTFYGEEKFIEEYLEFKIELLDFDSKFKFDQEYIDTGGVSLNGIKVLS